MISFVDGCAELIDCFVISRRKMVMSIGEAEAKCGRWTDNATGQRPSVALTRLVRWRASHWLDVPFWRVEVGIERKKNKKKL